MNERIKLLAEQAGIEFTYDPTETPMRAFAECWEDELEKFAELIVKEFVVVVENLSPGYEDYRNQIEDAFRRDCVMELKHHFGVEE